MSWPNEVQILSLASMAPSQVVGKHDFFAKVAGGCFSYDVIAPWLDLTRSIFFLPKIAQGLPHKVAEKAASTRRRFFPIREKPQRGRATTPPPVRARVKPRDVYVCAPRQLCRTGVGVSTPPLTQLTHVLDNKKDSELSEASKSSPNIMWSYFVNFRPKFKLWPPWNQGQKWTFRKVEHYFQNLHYLENHYTKKTFECHWTTPLQRCRQIWRKANDLV